MEKLTDAEIAARLIYKAFVAPDLAPGERLSDDALVTFPMALKLYARLAREEFEKEMVFKLDLPRGLTDEEVRRIYGGPRWLFPDNQTTVISPSQPTMDEPIKETEPPKPLTDNIKGQGAEEKKEIHADLMAFIGRHGIGARKMIADTSKGKLTLSDVMDLTDCKQKPLSAWRAARDAMFAIEDEENR